MNDLEKARELAQRLGYIADGPEVIVGDATPPARIAQLKAAGFNPVNMDDRDRFPRIEPNPDGGMTYREARSPGVYAAAGLSISAGGSAPTHLEFAPSAAGLSSRSIAIDRFSLTPAGDLYGQMFEGLGFAYAEPPMFNSGGGLPSITASGVDPSLLRQCAWYLRHSAAFTESRSRVLAILEDSLNLDGEPDMALQTPDGGAALREYVARAQTWANAAPTQPVDTEQIDEFIASAYPSND